jgi:pentatricopeptide repeat protein
MLQLGFILSVASMKILIGGLCHGGEALKAAEVFAEFLVHRV